jgi:hypothetical protein
MTQIQVAYLPRLGTLERWRRLCQEVAELRQDRFAAFCQQAGITQVQVRLFQLLHSELLLLTVQTQELHQTLQALARPEDQLDPWLRDQLRSLLGWDIQEVLSDPPSDLIFTWERRMQ